MRRQNHAVDSAWRKECVFFKESSTNWKDREQQNSATSSAGKFEKVPPLFQKLRHLIVQLHHHDTFPLIKLQYFYSCVVSKSVFISSLAKSFNPYWILLYKQICKPLIWSCHYFIANIFSVVSYASVICKIFLNWGYVWLFLVLCKSWSIFVEEERTN